MRFHETCRHSLASYYSKPADRPGVSLASTNGHDRHHSCLARAATRPCAPHLWLQLHWDSWRHPCRLDASTRCATLWRRHVPSFDCDAFSRWPTRWDPGMSCPMPCAVVAARRAPSYIRKTTATLPSLPTFSPIIVSSQTISSLPKLPNQLYEDCTIVTTYTQSS